MLHALGIEYTSRNKKVEPNTKYRPHLLSHRNYYQIDNCEDWNLMVNLKLATFRKGYYFVTDYGKSYLRDLGYIFKDLK